MKKILNPIKIIVLKIIWPLVWLKLQFNSLVYNPLLYKSFVKKADNLHKITGYQFHVMPMAGGQLVLMSKNYVKPGECISLKGYNKAMKITGGKQLGIMEILKWSYYSTPAKR